MATYGSTSPYASTSIKNGQYLDVFQIRPVPAQSDDVLYNVQPQYTHRPDLLAYDLYGTSKLWWVFAQRNMDILKDPVFDLIPGINIFLPRPSPLQRLLGY
jgi:hypothetical protein